MSRRRVLNIATQKKHDNRLTFSNVQNGGVPPTQQAVVMNGGPTYIIPYICTAQDRSPATFDVPNYRQRDDVFMRGYRERIQFSVNNGSSWTWRRICFRLKGNAIINSVSATSPLWLEASPNGWTRSATNANGTGLGTSIISEVFDGQVNVDWTNYFVAALDTNRITVMYDKTRTIKPYGNDQPHNHEYKLWHPMNANFYYRDDESGETSPTSPLHSSGIRGMGDYYIVDFITCSSVDTDDIAVLNYEGTLFWHER